MGGGCVLSQGNARLLQHLSTDLSNATTSLTPGYSRTSQRSNAVSIATVLGFKDRYFFDGSLRKDGSSLFGEDQRYHNYYRASLAWLLSDEPWFRPLSNVFDQFKLRSAIGSRPSSSSRSRDNAPFDFRARI